MLKFFLGKYSMKYLFPLWDFNYSLACLGYGKSCDFVIVLISSKIMHSSYTVFCDKMFM